MELEGKRVVLKKKLFGKSFQDEASRTVDVTGGFGSNAHTNGTALFVRFLDGTTGHYRGEDVEKFIGDAGKPRINPTVKVGDIVFYGGVHENGKRYVSIVGLKAIEIDEKYITLEDGTSITRGQVNDIWRDRTG
jgi:hypothetical protein